MNFMKERKLRRYFKIPNALFCEPVAHTFQNTCLEPLVPLRLRVFFFYQLLGQSARPVVQRLLSIKACDDCLFQLVNGGRKVGQEFFVVACLAIVGLTRRHSQAVSN